MRSAKILVVDDDENVLKALRRHLHHHFNLTTAMSGTEAIEKLMDHGPFAVVMSDMKMPGMNGVELLHRVEEIAPDTVKIMLTGNVDQATAVQAINKAHTFRFLTKPCPTDELIKNISEGVEHYHMQTSSKPTQKARAAFLSVVNHELRTPLNPIIGFANMLLDSDLDQEKRECVQEIIDAGNHMVDLVNDLCAYVEISVGGINISNSPFSLVELCQTVMNHNRQAANAKSLNLNLILEEGLPQTVLGDFKILAKTLNHIINNAIKYTEVGEVHVQVIKTSSSESTVHCRFDITDTGTGIDPEIGDKIFEPCYQVDSSMTRKGSGLGIGLAVCKGWVDALGGQIDYLSEQGKGTTFRINIPFLVPSV